MAPLPKESRPVRPSPNLERDAIWFTIGLYLLICAGLLSVHYAHPQHPAGSSSGSAVHQER